VIDVWGRGRADARIAPTMRRDATRRDATMIVMEFDFRERVAVRSTALRLRARRTAGRATRTSKTKGDPV